MLTDFWIPLTIFAAIAALTPGPNNLMLAASGMNYGFRRTVPHITSCWTSLGTVIRKVLEEPKVRRWVNRGMAAALVLTMLPILLNDSAGQGLSR